jgi:hypothetical protein
MGRWFGMRRIELLRKARASCFNRTLWALFLIEFLDEKFPKFRRDKEKDVVELFKK